MGGIRSHYAQIESGEKVSSRAPVWGASALYEEPREGDLFQVVPPCGGHRTGTPERVLNFAVSSRAPVWGASGSGPAVGHTVKFQVVPPCGGHLALIERESGYRTVSSRAPVWGASRGIRI